NDALIKDGNLYRDKSKNFTLHEANTTLLQYALDKGLSWNEITKLMQANDHDGQESLKQSAPYRMYDAVCRGHVGLAAGSQTKTTSYMHADLKCSFFKFRTCGYGALSRWLWIQSITQG